MLRADTARVKRLLLAAGPAAIILIALGFARTPAPRAIPAAIAAEPPSPVERGRLAYGRYGCAMCHGAEGKGGFANPNSETDGRVPGVLYVKEGYTAAELRDRLLDGVRTVGKADARGTTPPFRMPGWRGSMTNREADDLVQFLFSLYPASTEEKWR